MNQRPRIWPVVLASAIGVVILCGLGFWQVQRLHWKEGLLAQLAANAAAAPIDLATADAVQRDGRSIEFVRIGFRATYKFDAEMKMISTFEGGPGWTIITPAVTPGGQAVLVDRGQVPADRLESYDKPQGEVEITGIIRQYANGRARFDPDNDAAKNQWYWWDIPAMLQASHLPGNGKPLPFVVQLLPAAVTADLPRPPEPRANLSNNHLGYAITWFGLALVLLVIAGLFLRGQMKKPPLEASSPPR